MNTLIYTLVFRYLWDLRSQKSSSTMVIVCFMGIFIGSFALTLVASIMSGFEKVTHEKLQGIHAQLIMQSPGNELNSSKILSVFNQEFPEIVSASPVSYKQVVLQKDSRDEIGNALVLKVVDPRLEEKTTSIASKIISIDSSTKSFSEILTNNTILIGDKLAQTLNSNIGDILHLLFIPSHASTTQKIYFEKFPVEVGGIFSTGIEEFDTSLVFASFPLAEKIFGPMGITQINIRLKPDAHEENIIEKLKNRFQADVFSWRALYPALVAALKLEKYAMFFILALIVLVASMNIISLMYMQIIRKRPDIAIYKAMGMSNGTITALFMYIGMILSVIATLFGLLGATLVGLFLQKYPFITLPDSYYVSHLPIHMQWQTFVGVLTLVIITSFLATLLPCKNISSIKSAQVLRFEG